MFVDPCIEQNIGQRRLFWSTQAGACGDYVVCGYDCKIPGLKYEDTADGRTIVTDEWLQGLILNILNTRARTDLRCPAPSAIYGHWSESYRNDGMYIGSTLWNAAEKSYVRTNDAVRLIGVAVRSDMEKLVAMGVAVSVDIETTYVGNNTVTIVVTAFTAAGKKRVELAGSFVSETWVWR